jgi:hypothetical protein
MKKLQITYWITTALLSGMMLLSVFMYLTAEPMKAAFAHLGFPQYFRIELAVLKLLGVIALLTPALRGRIREWAYFGFFATFVSAFVAHATVGDPVNAMMSPVVATLLLAVSYLSYRRLRSPVSAADRRPKASRLRAEAA